MPDTKFAIVDVETANPFIMPKEEGWWDFEKGFTILLGVAIADEQQIYEIIQIVKTKENEKTFDKECKTLLDSTQSKYQMWAFNKKYDVDALNKSTGKEYLINDIIVKGSSLSKYILFNNKLKAIKKNIPDIPDPFKGRSVRVFDAYKDYYTKDNLNALENIKLHNKSCLMMEWHIKNNVEDLSKRYRIINGEVLLFTKEELIEYESGKQKEFIEKKTEYNPSNTILEQMYLQLMQTKDSRRIQMEKYSAKVLYFPKHFTNAFEQILKHNDNVIHLSNLTLPARNMNNILAYEISFSFLFKIYPDVMDVKDKKYLIADKQMISDFLEKVKHKSLFSNNDDR